MRQNTPEDPPQTTPDAKNSPAEGRVLASAGERG